MKFTLLSDGSSDRVLLRILDWLLRQHVSGPVQGVWSELRSLREPPRSLRDRVRRTLELYPCNLLFVHRDAENKTQENREKEIKDAIGDCPVPPLVCVVPIRMQEAWLLIDEAALRQAAGNPNGSFAIEFPRLEDLETLANPKKRLHELLRIASELRGRRLKRFRSGQQSHRLAELIGDFSLLRRLKAFQRLESDLKKVLEGEAGGNPR